MPSFGVSVWTSLVPVVLMAMRAIAEMILPKGHAFLPVAEFLGDPVMATLIAVLIAMFTFGLNRGRSMDQINDTLVSSIKIIQEHIAHEPRALQLLARAAEGSLRDALSLTDQAIASGDGQVSTQAVSAMLGTLDDDQALSLVEAMVEANGERVMALINDAAARGIEWEALLVEMLGLLHRIAMVQLSPAALGNDMAAIELRMRELARPIPHSRASGRGRLPAMLTAAPCMPVLRSKMFS